MILILPILISLMSTATVEAFSSNSNNNINNSNSNINNNLNSQLTRQRSPSLPQQVRRSSSSSALSAHGFHTNHHDSLVYTSSLVRSSSVPTNINRNRNRRKRSSSSHRSGPLFLAPMDLVAFSSAISAKYQAKKGAVGLIQKVAGKAVVVTTSASTATTSAALITTATVAATATATVTAAATATATDTTVVATAAAAATTTISDSAHQMVVATATAIASPDKQAEVLSDSSFALCEYPTFLPDMKTSKLRIKVAQVLGRILIIGISLLPGHTFHPEELAIQLFLLGGSIQPLIRSMKLLRKIQAVQCNKDGCVIDFAELEDDDELGDVESTSAVIDGAGHGRLEYTFGGDTGTGGGSDSDNNNNGGVSVQCNSDGCTIDFDDLNDDDDSLGDVVTDDDMSVILECTLTGDDDGGLECTAIPDNENSEKYHDHTHHNNLVTASFDDVNVDSSRAAPSSRVVVE